MTSVTASENVKLKSRIERIREGFLSSDARVRDSIFRLAPSDMAGRDEGEAIGFTDWREWNQWSKQLD